MKAAAIYARVSTDDQKKNFSLPSQIKECRAYAQEHGFTVDDAHIFEESFTGNSLERPQLDRLRALASAGAVGAVIVLDLDRLARNVAYQILIEEEFTKYDVPVQYVNDQFDESPEGQLQKGIRSVIAQYERAKFKQRGQRGRKERAKQGYVHTGRTAPYGYRYVHGDKKGWLEKVPDEAEVVRLMFEWYVYGDDTRPRMGIQAVASRLSSMGIPSKNEKIGGAKPKKKPGVWGKSTVRRILTSEVYAGVWNYGRTKRTGKTTYVRCSQEEWIPVDVPAIVSHELWEAAQRAAQEHRIQSPRNTKRVYLMQHRLKCPVCGLVFQCWNDGRNPNRPKGYYYCGGQKVYNSADFANKTCHRSLRHEQWDPRIWDAVVRVLKNPDETIGNMKEQQASLERELESSRGWLASIEKKIEGVKGKQARLLEMLLEENPPMLLDMLQEQKAHLAQQRQDLEYEAQTLRDRLEASSTMNYDITQVRQYCQEIAKGIDNFTDEDKRFAIEALKITGVVRRGETPAEDVITLTGYIPTLEVPTQGEAAVIEDITYS